LKIRTVDADDRQIVDLDEIANASGKTRIVVLLPCLNEAAAIGDVVRTFRAALPMATVYVYDNNSTDHTPAIAADAGAVVRREIRQGKGSVVRRMFSDIEADIYVLADGDGTYDASVAGQLVEQFMLEQLDFLNGARVHESDGAYRHGHKFGNWLLTSLVRWIFGRQLNDMLSGYKVLSRRYVKSFPAMSAGFEIETELAVHALELRMPMAEIPTRYFERHPDSASKLRTLRDGARILSLIARLVKDERPLQFFGLLGLATIIAGLCIGFPVLITYFQTGLVPRFPTAILSLGLVTIGAISIFCGLILDMVTYARREIKRLFYLSIGHRTARP
jgi:glycosyltransferase involved in cell wall biosynthesis